MTDSVVGSAFAAAAAALLSAARTRVPMQASTEMYVPVHFNGPRDEVMHALIRACPLGVLVVAGAGGPAAAELPRLVAEPPGAAC